MNSKITINDFSPHLFLGVDLAKFDWDSYKNFLIFKTLEEGQLTDWKLVKEKYGIDEVRKVSLELEGFDIVTVTFLAAIFKTNISDFKSYHPLMTSKGFRQIINNAEDFNFQ